MKQQSDINKDGVTMDKKDVFAVSGLMESISR